MRGRVREGEGVQGGVEGFNKQVLVYSRHKAD